MSYVLIRIYISRLKTGLPNVFGNFSPVFKSTHFGSIFSLKLNLRKGTVLNSIKRLKRYCRAT